MKEGGTPQGVSPFCLFSAAGCQLTLFERELLFLQKALLEDSESVEGIEWCHGEEVHLPDFLQHGVWCR